MTFLEIATQEDDAKPESKWADCFVSLATHYHWTPDVLNQLTFPQLRLWIDATEKLNKKQNRISRRKRR